LNPYKIHIDFFFARQIELRHYAYWASSRLNDSVKSYRDTNHKYFSGSALIISDWLGESDNGWEINHPTGFIKSIGKENYDEEVVRIIGNICCYTFSQSFETLEKLIKDCLYEFSIAHTEFQKQIKLTNDKIFKRENIPGGNELIDIIKKVCEPFFNDFSQNNERNYKLKELWTVLSEARHAITHSSSMIKNSKINKSDYHYMLFDHLFSHKKVNDDLTQLLIDYQNLNILIKRISEYGFIIFKFLCLKENLDWKIL
jgi:hypothetical protein